MKILLDTHVWLWSLLKPERLSAKTRKILDDHRNEFWVSPVSAWEILVLVDKNRLKGIGDPYSWLRSAMEKTKSREAPLTMEIALLCRLVNLPHEDPADRFLVATAKALDLFLLTGDEKILASQPCKLLEA